MSKKEVCKLCKKGYERIATHLTRTHKVEPIEYYKKYDRDKYLTKLQLKFINDFYISYRKQHIKMDSNGQITTIDGMLNDGSVKQHLSQKHRIGIKFSNSGSDVIGLDIDILDVEALYSTCQTLLNYDIPSNSILTTFSGNKGYHVDIFLENYIDRKLIQAFYEIVLNDVGYSTAQIELRGASNEGYFLPFGINYKGKSNRYYGFCGIVNHLGVMEHCTDNEIDKLDTMDKLDSNIIKDIVLINYQMIERADTTGENETDDIEEVNDTLQTLELLDVHSTSIDDVVAQIGTRTAIQDGTRHKLAFIYAQALRDYGFSEVELYNQLILWHDNLESGYKSSWCEIENDCKNIVKSVFMKQGNKFRYNLPKNSKAYITRTNVKQFIDVKSKADRRIFLALAIQSNTFKDYEGHFYMTYKQINEILGLQARNKDILKYIKRLEQNGLVKIIRRDKRIKGKIKHEPNVYKIVADSSIEILDKDIYYLSSNSTINKLEMADAIKKVLTVREYKSLVKNKKNLYNILSCLVA